MNEERLQEIKDSVDFQREMLLAHNLGTLCVDEEQELIDEIERLNTIINEYDKWLESEIQRLEKFQNPKRGVKPYGQEYNNITFLIGAYDNALDKLQELKGSDKE